MFIRRSHCRLFALLLGWLLFVTPVHIRANANDDESLEHPQNTAWLSLIVDTHGQASVTFSVPVADANREQLQRALSESFSFPVQFYNDVEESDAEESAAWTSISAKSPQAFSGRLKSTCRVDLQSIITQLRAHNVERLRFWVLFQNASTDHNIEGAEKVLLRKGLSFDRYDAEFDVRAPVAQAINFSMGYGISEIIKRTIPLLLFLLLPAVWTKLAARRFRKRPAELWGRHLLFLHRLLTALWLIWLPVYALSGIAEIVFYLPGPDHRDVPHVINLAFYFIPPIAESGST